MFGAKLVCHRHRHRHTTHTPTHTDSFLLTFSCTLHTKRVLCQLHPFLRISLVLYERPSPLPAFHAFAGSAASLVCLCCTPKDGFTNYTVSCTRTFPHFLRFMLFWVSCFATVFLLYRPNPTCVQDSATWIQMGQVRLFSGSPGRSWAQPGPILRTQRQRPTLRTCILIAISNIFALCWVSCQPMLPTLVLSCAPYTGPLAWQAGLLLSKLFYDASAVSVWET